MNPSRLIIAGLSQNYKPTLPTSGLFSFMDSHFIMLTASKGFEARYFILSAIRVIPANRNTDNAVFRMVSAITCGIAPHRADDASSPSCVSRIQCDLFSIDQCHALG